MILCRVPLIFLSGTMYQYPLYPPESLYPMYPQYPLYPLYNLNPLYPLHNLYFPVSPVECEILDDQCKDDENEDDVLVFNLHRAKYTL